MSNSSKKAKPPSPQDKATKQKAEKPDVPRAVKRLFQDPKIAAFFRNAGAEGGAARAARHTKEELAEWGRKGGRPRKNPPKEKKPE